MQYTGERGPCWWLLFSLGSRRWDCVLNMKGRVLGQKFKESESICKATVETGGDCLLG